MPLISTGTVDPKPPLDLVLLHLKQSTRDVHHQLEDRLDLLNLTEMPEYQRVLTCFSEVYGGLEPQMEDRPEWAPLDWRPIAKRPWLAEDLNFFGLPLPEVRSTVHLEGWQEVLGATYVVEGSMLGGQLITRHLQTLGITPQTGGRFFSGHQSQTGEVWKQVRQFLLDQTTDVEQVVRGAQKTFQSFLDALDRTGEHKKIKGTHVAF